LGEIFVILLPSMPSPAISPRLAEDEGIDVVLEGGGGLRPPPVDQDDTRSYPDLEPAPLTNPSRAFAFMKNIA